MITPLRGSRLLQYGVVAGTALLIWCTAARAADFKFAFGSDKMQPGYTRVSPGTPYEADRGYGILESAAAKPGTSTVFAVDVEEGNYDVTMRFGNAEKATSTTIKAESRRLMVDKVETAPGQYETRTFTINVRRPAISTGGTVSLSELEKGPPPVADWDEHLTFEFNGKSPGVASLEIKPTTDAITLFIAGDSTVTDQAKEPWSSWGQMLPRFFGQGVAVSNHSWSGLTLSSFEHQKRLDKVLSMMKQGDYLFIQFGHNDQKEKPPAGPFTSYKANLKRYIQAVRSKGGIPVIVTPMERRRWNGNEPLPTLADFAEAGRQVGAEENVPVIDLNAMSLKFYKALGPDQSTKAFVHYPANSFPDQDKALKDNTHHNAYGGYELARCVVEGIKSKVPALAPFLAKDVGTFDPSKPDAPEKFDVPASPLSGATEKPAGS
jgi:lysophospholipase L1-like esterase